ncbi:MAG: tetratricopeptide repeat protein [Planctomyces sp.]|jgi:predicted TPR repeat methyltransferase
MNFFAQGKELQAQGKLPEAVAAYRQAIDEDPESFKAWNNLGTTFAELNDPDQALACYQRALEIDAAQSIVHYNLARTLHQMGRGAEAFGHYAIAIDLNPQSFAAQFNFSLLLYETQEWKGAEASLRRTLELAPENPGIHQILGKLLFDRQRPGEALRCYERALELDGTNPEYAFHAGACLHLLGQLEQASGMFERSLELNPRSRTACEHLLNVLLEQGQKKKAVDVCERYLRDSPEDSVICHRLAAITKVNPPVRASDGYVQGTFDAFASNFDATLSRLQYRAPEHLATMAAQRLPAASGTLMVLDAGCGTGLCGVLFRKYAMRLSGLDLSGEMLRMAKERDVYDELLQGELTDHLRQCPAVYDLIIAADTLNYFGSLQGVFQAAAIALRADGRLLFTLEHDHGAAAEWLLLSHGRYCHSEAYLHKVLGDAGFFVDSSSIQTLRWESGQPVSGWIVSARRSLKAPERTIAASLKSPVSSGVVEAAVRAAEGEGE